jgi:hypothetical protein
MAKDLSCNILFEDDSKQTRWKVSRELPTPAGGGWFHRRKVNPRPIFGSMGWRLRANKAVRKTNDRYAREGHARFIMRPATSGG